MITKVNIPECPGYYFTYDPENSTVPIRFYTYWKQTGTQEMAFLEHNPIELRQHKNCGYYRVHLRDKNRKRKIHRVHCIVAKCLIDNPFNLETVDHIDNNKANNHPSNLQWLSFSYNSKKNAFTNEKSAARARQYEIHFLGGHKQVVFCLKDFSKESGGYYNYHCMCKVAQKKNHTHKDIICINEVKL